VCSLSWFNQGPTPQIISTQPAMRKTIFVLSLLLHSLYSFSQITISGKIADASNGEDLFWANIYIDKQYISTTSNEYGFYSLQIDTTQIKSKSVEVIYSYIGFKSQNFTFSVSKSSTKNIALEVSSNEISEVEVSAEARRNQEIVNSTQVSAVQLDIKSLKDLPTLAGEKDIIKTMQLLPGIAGGAEGTTDFFVRGGDGDQNLILLDEATVYNVGHLFGFFSVFNSDALKEVTLYKGGFPGEFGGRLSSIMDIKQKGGNQKKWEVNGGIGLISSRLTVEGPIIKNKSSILLSGRRTYIDQVSKLEGQDIPYYFYDFNWKINYTFNEKNRLFYSGYLGDDVLRIQESGNDKADPEDPKSAEESEENFNVRFGFNLGNIAHTLRWNHIYNEKLFSNVTFTTTDFDYDISGQIDSNSLLIKSEIKDFALKAKFNYYESNRSTYSFGGEVIQHRFKPNVISTAGDISEFLKSREADVVNFQEMAIFGHRDYDLIEKILKLNYGLRISSALTEGKLYAGLEPRFSARYTLNERSSIKWSYSRMKQYMHRVSSSTISLPTDLWYPITRSIKPQRSDQTTIGYYLNLPKIKSIFTAEIFYKTMNNLIEYKEGSNLLLNDDFEADLVQGDGRAYGLELLIKKDFGKFKGWVGYTLSKSERTFDGVNFGNTFPAKYDRRHDLSIVASYDIGKRISIGSVWVYASGSKFTAQIGQYYVPNASLTGVNRIPIFSERNAINLSPSHRLDVNFTIKPREGKKWYREWQFGAYNLYNRAQPFTVDIQASENVSAGQTTVQQKYEQPGIFGTIFYFTFNFKIQ